jgi:4-diphosphocytidyl-2-C-methyl-D-erythritol kinase
VTPELTAVAAAKINLALRVGPRRADGYHPLNSLFHSVDLVERVTVTASAAGGDELAVSGLQADAVPLDQTNLTLRAAELLRGRFGPLSPVYLRIDKAIPVAGGLAGGSADGAAALVVLNAWWGLGLSRLQLVELAAELGSDVPFAVLGAGLANPAVADGVSGLVPGPALTLPQRDALSTPPVSDPTAGLPSQRGNGVGARFEADPAAPQACAGGNALGRGRGEDLRPVQSAGTFEWVLVTSADGLSTPEVFARFDAMGAARGLTEPPDVPEALLAGLAAGDPWRVGAHLVNDLQPAAFALRPQLADTIECALAEGACGALVSGSGPTVACLTDSAAAAEALRATLTERLSSTHPPAAILRAAGPFPSGQATLRAAP